jgi:predicted ABC-type ATPase
MNKSLFIIAGCNGAGKTTASFNILPDILNCKEFVNADEIARGISPFQPEKVSIEAGRIMLQRIEELINQKIEFAFETTLSTRSFTHLIQKAKNEGYTVTMIFLWLETTDLAIKRVQSRVEEGGHYIPEETIIRRYYRGLSNLFNLYFDLCELILLYDNSNNIPDLIFEKTKDNNIIIHQQEKYKFIKTLSL